MNDLNYKIVKFDENSGQIYVRFDDYPLIIIDLPIKADGSTIFQNELDGYIRGFLPTSQIDRKTILANGITNAEEIRCLVEPEIETENAFTLNNNFPNAEYEASDISIVSEMLRLADVVSSDHVFDLGCGDGKIIIEAAKLGALATGIDLNRNLLSKAALNAAEEGVVVCLKEENIFETNVNGATVITLFLNSASMDLLWKKVSTLPIGTRIVSNMHKFTWWPPEKVSCVGNSIIYLWVVK